MTSLKTQLLSAARLALAALALAAMLLLVGQDLFALISPWMLLASAAIGVLLLVAVVSMPFVSADGCREMLSRFACEAVAQERAEGSR